MINKRELKKLSVLIKCQEDENTKYGSGNVVEIDGTYYVLTAAHCILKKDNNSLCDINRITVTKDVPEDLANVTVEEILYNPELGDLAALRISLGEREQKKLSGVLSKLRILDGDFGMPVTISGYLDKGESWNTYSLNSSGDIAAEGLVKYQYQGPDVNNQNDPINFWKGMSGSGLFFQYDTDLFMTAILVSTDNDLIQSNEFYFIPAKRFSNLVPSLTPTTAQFIEDKETLHSANQKGVFRILADSLLKIEEFTFNAFISSGKLKEIITSIRDDDNETLLISALSGMGKSRLLFEAFKEHYPLNNCFYARYSGDKSTLLKEATNLMSNNRGNIGLLVVDDCDLDVFEELCSIRRQENNQFRIIATNHDFFEARRLNIKKTILLEADDIRTDINKFIDDQLSITDENKAIRDEIKKMSDGYPQMAIDLVKAYQSGIDPEMGIVEALMRKLLQFKEDDKKAYIMQTLSLCQPMPYCGQQRTAFSLMLESDNFTPLFANVSKEEREEIAESLIKKFSPTLIQTQSNWLLVRPFPLAVYLTSQWFNACPQSRFIKLLDEIKRQPTAIQNTISKGFCKHIELMRGNKSAFDLVEKLVSRPEGAPFLNEEVLCSGLGSEFFLAFSHVNPAAIAHCIWDILSLKSTEWIKNHLKELSRRNIVYALERLCFAEESFADAFKSLSKLSIAENEERLSNNASGQILQLFHIELAGTEVNLNVRLTSLRWLKEQGEEFLSLSLKCINSAFMSRGFTRMCGSERFGLERRQDYMPKTYKEIFDYWDSIRDILIQITNEHPEKLDEVISIIENHASNWLRDGYFELAYSLIDVVLDMRQDKWSSLYNLLSRNREFIVPTMSEADRTTFESYMAKMRPCNFIVTLSDARHLYWSKSYKLSDAENNQLAKCIFEPVVDTFLAQKIYESEAELTLLLDDKDYIDYSFITTLVERIAPEQLSSLFSTMIAILKKKDETYSSGLMMTLCRVFRHTDASRGFIAQVEQLGFKTLYIKLIAGNDLDNLDGYHQLKSQYKTPNQFLELYLMSYQSLNGDLYCQLLEQIHNDFPECSNELLHFVLLRRFFSSDGTRGKTVPIIKQLILDYKVNPEHGNDTYEYSRFVADFIENVKDVEFAQKVCYKFIELDNNQNIHLNMDSVFTALLKHYPNNVWEMIANAIVSKDYYLFYFQVRNELGSGSGFGAGPFFQVPNCEQRVKDLCNKYPETAPIIISELAPCFRYEQKGDKNVLKGFSNYFLWLLENYGVNDHVRNGIYANLGSFSWTGSTIPYYDRNILCFKQLLDNPSMSSVVKQWADACIKQYEKEKSIELERETYIKLHYGNG